MKRVITTVAVFAALFAICNVEALVIPMSGGHWPASWPKEMESLRKVSKTLVVATGIQEHIYDLPFKNREEFEKLWPVLLSIRTPGSPLRLSRVSDNVTGWGDLVSNVKPCIRIKAPARIEYLERSKTSDSLPWSEAELRGQAGELPEYVISVRTNEGQRVWEPFKPNGVRKKHSSARYRARTEIELVVDGKIIDLNRIELPKDATILDFRFPKEEQKK